MKNCEQGIVKNAIVPAVTYCHLNLKDDYDNARHNLGKYVAGFWFDSGNYSLPFLRQSWTGEYVSPQLNGK